ncbi:MAG: sulfur carrier protein ThiS [Moraxella sp.]|nr:sulfur carrier protein ThiS [Moraxella sp.]
MSTVILNGVTITTTTPHVLALLEDYQLTQGRFAVEINGNLIPKQQLANTSLQDNMVIEVVQAVGGG